MKDLNATSCNNSDTGFSPILLLFLLMTCTGDNGIMGGGSCTSGCGCNKGLDGILPILLLMMCGGGSIC